MAKTKTIPAGYRFTFDSWENDGDSPRKVTLQGLSEEHAQFVAELAKLIQARKTGLENIYDPDEKAKKKAYKVLWPVFEKYSSLFDADDMDLFKEDIGQMVDYINENMLGYPSEDGVWLRVLETFEAEYFPGDVVSENVTARFMKKKNK